MSVQLSPDTDRKSPQIGKRLSVPATQNLLSGFLVLFSMTVLAWERAQ